MSIFTRKPKCLSVVDAADSTRVGVLQVVRGGNFQLKDRLHIFDIYPLRDCEEMKVYVLKGGRANGAGTLRVKNGNFRKGQTIVVDAVG